MSDKMAWTEARIKQEMYTLLGMMDALCFVFIGEKEGHFYDLASSMKERYESILKQTVGFEE